MVNLPYRVVWTKRSQQHMRQIFEYISEFSAANAHKVLTDILEAVQKASSNPEVYGRDKYKNNNDGSYRAFELHRYRVAYRFAEDTIRVLRVRHTSMEPKNY
jgi:plasmid stabilization system protein ParE